MACCTYFLPSLLFADVPGLWSIAPTLPPGMPSAAVVGRHLDPRFDQTWRCLSTPLLLQKPCVIYSGGERAVNGDPFDTEFVADPWG